jgi:hypothetical protein
MTYLFKYARDSESRIIPTTDPIEILVYIPRKANLVASKGFPILSSSKEDAQTAISTCGTIYVYSEQ